MDKNKKQIIQKDLIDQLYSQLKYMEIKYENLIIDFYNYRKKHE